MYFVPDDERAVRYFLNEWIKHHYFVEKKTGKLLYVMWEGWALLCLPDEYVMNCLRRADWLTCEDNVPQIAAFTAPSQRSKQASKQLSFCFTLKLPPHPRKLFGVAILMQQL